MSRRPSNNSDAAIAVSVVVPVLNEERDIGRLLGGLVTQTWPQDQYEVIVVDGGSSDATLSIVMSFVATSPNIRLVGNRGRLSSAGRNVGYRMARGKFVLFVDGHCDIPTADYIAQAVSAFRSTGTDCLCRAQPLNRLVDGEWEYAIATARHSWLGHAPGSDIYAERQSRATNPMSAGAAYRCQVLARLDGFDERFDACEDVEFNYRVKASGYTAYLCAELALHYRPRSSLQALRGQMIRYGRGRARLWMKHPRAVPVYPLVALVLIAALTGLCLTRSPMAVSVALGFVALWFLATLITASVAARHLRAAIRVTVALVTIHVSLLIGFLLGLLTWPSLRVKSSAPDGAGGSVYSLRR